jgi:hypothetical protein
MFANAKATYGREHHAWRRHDTATTGMPVKQAPAAQQAAAGRLSFAFDRYTFKFCGF